MTLHALTAQVKQRPAHFVSFIPYRRANSNHIISLYIVQHASLKYESSLKNNHKIISECQKKKNQVVATVWFIQVRIQNTASG